MDCSEVASIFTPYQTTATTNIHDKFTAGVLSIQVSVFISMFLNNRLTKVLHKLGKKPNRQVTKTKKRVTVRE